MKNNLDIITALSHEFGTARYVMGGGGNTSCKDRETLWIKPSGTTLLGLAPERFIAMDRARLATLFTIETPADATAREALVKSVMEAAVKPETPGRASVEAPVHECFEARFVVHTHPTLANGLACALGGREAAGKWFPDSLWLDYTDPGYTLSLRVRKELEAYRANHEGREPRLVWLQNHGVFVAGNTAEEIRETYAHLMGRLEEAYRAAGVDTATPAPGTAPPDSFREAALPVLQAALGTDATVVLARPPINCAAGPVSPDHLVYVKSYIYEGVVTEEALRAFAARRGYPARVLALPEGMLACGATAAVAERAAEFAADAARIRQLARAFGGVQYLSDAARRFLENWEVESYRARQTG
ncbi:MAG: class II aldolase [Lentisphaerae bacterium]|jgi:rhamnose utilization protein RhaD (predicted bifunctional aldolase and dehydrogenase)|nr:class II aldolase [Lentisphaerota bacterium]